WQQDHARSFAVFLNGDGLEDVDEEGRPIHGESVLLLFNAHHDAVAFTLPPEPFGAEWQSMLDTSSDAGDGAGPYAANETLQVPGRTVIVLARRSRMQ